MVFRGNIVACITGDIFSDQGAGTVVWDISNEKYFHQISNSYFQPCFLLNFVENFMIFLTKLDTYVRIQDSSADKPYEKHCIF